MTWRYTNRWFQFYTLNLVVLYLQSTIVRTRKLTLYIFTGWFLSCWFNKKMGYDGEITVYDLAMIFHEKKNNKKIQWLININSTQSQQKMSTHSIHVRVVCQSAAIEHMDFVRDSYDFLKSIPAVAWKAWRFCVQENTIRSNSRHGHYNLSSLKSLW